MANRISSRNPINSYSINAADQRKEFANDKEITIFVLRKDFILEENKTMFNSIDEYILQFPPEVQEILKKVRKAVKEAAPEAEEKISYRMPTFYLHGNLVHFAAHKNHIGFYPTPNGIDAFKMELSDYKSAKGSVQFPYDKPIPYELIKRIVKFRVTENLKTAKGKTKKK